MSILFCIFDCSFIIFFPAFSLYCCFNIISFYLFFRLLVATLHSPIFYLMILMSFHLTLPDRPERKVNHLRGKACIKLNLIDLNASCRCARLVCLCFFWSSECIDSFNIVILMSSMMVSKTELDCSTFPLYCEWRCGFISCLRVRFCLFEYIEI